MGINKILLSVCLTFAALAASAQVSVYEEARKQHNFAKEYYEFAGKTYDGKQLSSEDMKGKVVLYIMGGYPCPPCIEISKAISDISQSEYKNNDNVKFVYITTDNKYTINKTLIKQGIKYDYIVSLTLGKIKEIGYIAMIKPTLVLVDKNGKVKKRGMGYAKEKKEEFKSMICSEIDKLL